MAVIVDGIHIPDEKAEEAVRRCISAIIAIDSISSKYPNVPELSAIREILSGPPEDLEGTAD